MTTGNLEVYFGAIQTVCSGNLHFILLLAAIAIE